MSETRASYLVSTQQAEPDKATLLPFNDPEYREPSWQDLRAVIQHLGWTGSQVGEFTGVGSRTVRKWTSPPDTSNHSPVPFAAWRLLLIAAGLVEAPDKNGHH
jgi:hypothetical protein